MTDSVKNSLKEALDFVGTFLKWVVIAAFVGCVCGGIGAAFSHSINFGASLFAKYNMLVLALPLAGVVTVALYKVCKIGKGVGTDTVIGSVNSDKKIPGLLAPLIFVCTVLTHTCGGSAGREGAALQFGGSIAAVIGRLLRLDEKDVYIITICGMGGMFAAVFGTPLTAAFFAMEVISVGVIYFSAFIPSVMTALVSYKVAILLGVTPLAFKVSVPGISAVVCLKIVVLSALCAVLSIVFCLSIHCTARLLSKYIKNDYLRIIAGGCAVAALTLILGTTDYNGAGTAIIAECIGGKALPYAFILKIIFTALTVSVGYKGGEIIPTFFVGATFGCAVGGLLGLNPAFGAAIGIIAMFCGVTNCPIASIFMSVEIFGGAGVLIFALAAGVSYLLSGYYGLYSSQKIIYSKLRPEYINRLAK